MWLGEFLRDTMETSLTETRNIKLNMKNSSSGFVLSLTLYDRLKITLMDAYLSDGEN